MSVNVAMIGRGFGAEFSPIYQNHPEANIGAICRRDESQLHTTGDNLASKNGTRTLMIRLRTLKSTLFCTGICAHDSATRGGEIVRLPEFTQG